MASKDNNINEITHIEKRILGQTDMNVPQIGFGCAFSLSNAGQFKEIVQLALQYGINYFDASPFYGQGQVEKALGIALEGVDRSHYYIATKAGRYPASNIMCSEFDFSSEKLEQTIDQSIENMKCGYLDICQLHDIEFCSSIDQIINESLPTLQKAKACGKIRYIGISGYSLKILKEVVEKSKVKIDTVLSYCRLNMHDVSLVEYMNFFKSKGIGLINASINCMGLLTRKGAPQWHPASDTLKETCTKLVYYLENNRKMNTTQLSMHYGLSFNEIDCTLTSSLDINQLKENIMFANTPFSLEEQSIFNHIRCQYFDNKNFDWENIEIHLYNKIKANNQ